MCGSSFALAQKPVWDPIEAALFPLGGASPIWRGDRRVLEWVQWGTRTMHVEAARALIADHLAVGLEAVRDEASFSSDLGADSLDMVELAMRFEEELDISIGDEESESCETVSDALVL